MTFIVFKPIEFVTLVANRLAFDFKNLYKVQRLTVLPVEFSLELDWGVWNLILAPYCFKMNTPLVSLRGLASC